MDVDRSTLKLAGLETLLALGAALVFHLVARTWSDPRDPAGIALALLCVGLPLVSAGLRLNRAADHSPSRRAARRL